MLVPFQAVAGAGAASETGGDQGAVLFAKGEDASGRLGRFSAHLDDAAQEEGEPALPVASVANGLQVVEVRGAVALGRQVGPGVQEARML
jgi:hypothetical protein